jgi:hypothetical protein
MSLLGAALLVLSGALAGPATAAVRPHPDLDGDGRLDLVFGADRAVAILEGDGTERVVTAPETDLTNTIYGLFTVTGDFNGDGYDDVATGDGFFDDASGAVWVYAGGPHGTLGGDGTIPTVRIQEGHDGLPPGPGTPGNGDFFGEGIAAGDLTGDGVDDLVIAAPSEMVGSVEHAGRVALIPGSATGPRPAAARLLTQNTPGIPGVPEYNDSFGGALAIGDLTGDGRADLAIASPGENNDGMVQLLPGAAGGPTGAGTTSVTAAGLNIHPQPDSAAELGRSLAMGDLTGDGRADLVAGAPAARVGRATCGAVAILRGSAAGLSSARAQVVSQSSPKVAGICEQNDAWGRSLAVGDLTGDRRPELVVGAPVESVGALNGGGAYTVLRPSSRGVAGTGSFGVDENTANVPDVAELGDNFGEYVTLADVNRDGRLDVLAPAYGERDSTLRRTGSVSILISYVSGKPSRSSSRLTGQAFTPAVERLGRGVAQPAAPR